MARKMNDVDTEEELAEAFRSFRMINEVEMARYIFPS